MKNQYFGDVNDYRKYGLLRCLAIKGALRIVVCWMLTRKDARPDGRRTRYLKEASKWRRFDPKLYDCLCRKVDGHEGDPTSRNVRKLTASQLQHAEFYSAELSDSEEKRKAYFRELWERFTSDVIFFDPDDGLANNNEPKLPLKKGHKNSAKKLFRDEVCESLDRGFSVLFYQHFDRNSRKDFVNRLGAELGGMRNAAACFSFWTPHAVFFLVPVAKHLEKVEKAIECLRASEWARPNSCPTSRGNDKRQILIGEHSRQRTAKERGNA